MHDLSSRLTPFVFFLILSAGPIDLRAQDLPAFNVVTGSEIVSLPFRVKDAEFSSALNAIVAISESPNQLHLYDPDTNTLASVNLPLLPYCVSVSPDGLKAAVGHDAWISYIDLSAPALLKTIPLSANVKEIVLGGNGFVYAFESGSYIHSIDLETEVETLEYSWRRPSAARLHPALDKIYGADRGTSPDDIMRINISSGPADFAYDSVYHGDYAMCGNVWISMDGLRLFTACGKVFRASDDPSFDMRYGGSLSQDPTIAHTAHSASGNSIAVLPGYSQYSGNPRVDNEIHYYTHDFLLYRGKVVLPPFVVDTHDWAPRGRWLFFNASGTKQYIVVQAEEASGMLNDYGIVTIDCTNATATPDEISTTVGAAAATLQFSVTGTPGCGWKALSNVAWLNTTSNGVGDGTVTATVSANTTADTRTGTITIGSATFTVTQAASLPESLAATASSTSSISLTWTSSVSVDHYEVWRSEGGGFSLIATPASASHDDTTVAPNTAYLYRVRSILGGGGATAFGSPDYAHTFTFTDAPLSAGVPVQAAHIEELRTVTNALRGVAGVGSASFTDPSLAGITAKAAHINELQDALNAVRTSLALPALSFAPVPAGSAIVTSITEELRGGTQ